VQQKRRPHRTENTIPPKKLLPPPHKKPKYIDLLRKCKLRERLRAARAAMHALFPFNERQWLAWLGDEMAGARTDADVERVGGLYRTAVKDYLSVQLWVGYLE